MRLRDTTSVGRVAAAVFAAVLGGLANPRLLLSALASAAFFALLLVGACLGSPRGGSAGLLFAALGPSPQP